MLPGHAPAYGREGAVTTALNGLAARVGIGILREGGSALDADLATAFAQIVLGGDAVTSFFGILGIVHFDATSGEVTRLSQRTQKAVIVQPSVLKKVALDQVTCGPVAAKPNTVPRCCPENRNRATAR